MKVYEAVEVWLHALTSALDGSQWSALRPAKESPEDWVGLGSGLDAVKGKVVPVLLTEHHAMKAYWGSGCIVPRIL
jgi:hypothetical protein